MKYIIETILLGLAIYLAPHFITGITVKDFYTALSATIAIFLANISIGSILRFLTFPINFLSLGLVSFLISVGMILLVSYLLPGFKTQIIAAAKLAIILAFIKIGFNIIYPKKK